MRKDKCSYSLHLKFVLHVMITWAGAIRLTFIPVAAPATETWWAEARCIWRAASVGSRAFIEVCDLLGIAIFECYMQHAGSD